MELTDAQAANIATVFGCSPQLARIMHREVMEKLPMFDPAVHGGDKTVATVHFNGQFLGEVLEPPIIEKR